MVQDVVDTRVLAQTDQDRHEDAAVDQAATEAARTTATDTTDGRHTPDVAQGHVRRVQLVET